MSAVNWISSRTVISRITRNIKNLPAEYLEDIDEWIGEALRKMKTVHSLQLLCHDGYIDFHRTKLPCKMEGVVCVSYYGVLLQYNGGQGPQRKHNYYGTIVDSLFQSITPTHTSSGDLTDLDNRDSKFPRDLIIKLNHIDFCDDWYKINYNILETSIKCGPIKIWYSSLPKGEDNLPLIPDTEEYGEAIYRYCRMMLIEAGHPDPVMSYHDAVGNWNTSSDRAISSVSFPTMDEIRSKLERQGLL